MSDPYATNNVSPLLIAELTRALESVNDYGSVEIIIQGGIVTQISTRKIRKTSAQAKSENNS